MSEISFLQPFQRFWISILYNSIFFTNFESKRQDSAEKKII